MIVELLLTAITVVVLTVTLKAWLKFQKIRQAVNKIPGMDDIPLLGSSLQLKMDNLGFFNQMREFAGKHRDAGLFKTWVGTKPIVMVYKASTVEIFFNSSKHTKKGFMYDFLKPWLGEGLLISYGQKWTERRRLITPTFHFKILEHFAHVFNEQVEVLIRLLDSKADGPAFDFTPFIFRCMLDSICETAMGVKINAQEDTNSAYVRAVYRKSELVLYRSKYPWLWPDRLFRTLPSGREDTACLKILHDFTRKIINERRQELESQKNTTSEQKDIKTGDDDDNIYASSKRRRLAFVDMLLTEKSLSASDIQEEVDTFMFEGHDTTAAGTVWILYMLACYPELQSRVQQEVDSILNGEKRQLTVEDVQGLRYTECFIKETLRLYPPVSWITRETTEPCEIGGYSLPKGVTANIFIFELHRDPERFPNPEQFDPDRWLDDSTSKHNAFSYIPFAAGSRNCIGQRFAMLEMKVTVSHLMHNFSVACSFKREDLVPVTTLINKPHDPLPIQFIRRK